MSDICQWCVKTSSQIDSIEYELEEAQNRIKELEQRVKELEEKLDEIRFYTSPSKNPYPEDIFPLTTEEYCEIIPDGAERTAISGLLMRKGWSSIADKIYSLTTNNDSELSNEQHKAMESALDQ